MKVKANKSFIGVISMNKNEEREIVDKAISFDLIKSGLVTEIKENKKSIEKENKPIETKKTKTKKTQTKKK